MSRKKPVKAKSAKIKNDVSRKVNKALEPMRNALHKGGFNNEQQRLINGFTEAVIGFQPGSIGTELNQVTSLFLNMRWYLVSNMQQPLAEAYAEQGLVSTIIDVPVNDALRGGVEIHTQQLSPDQVQELQAEIERESFLDQVIGQAGKWSRLYGGGGVMIITDQDPKTPLDIEQIGPGRKLDFRAVDMWELYYDMQAANGYNPVIQSQAFQFYSYYGTQIHKSRVMPLVNIQAPAFLRPRLRGWGLSEVERMIAPINQFFKSNNLIFELMDEAKIDVFKIKGLAQMLMSADGGAVVRRRMQEANWVKNYQNALVLDSNDDYGQKQLTFSGLAEMKKEFRMDMACAMQMPITKIFGLSAQGFNAGEDDIENYNSMVESRVRNRLKGPILTALQLKCKAKWDIIPSDLAIEFKPLREMTAEQEENVKNSQHARLFSAVQSGYITHEQYLEACNKSQLFPIQMDVSDVELLEQGGTDENDDSTGPGQDKGEGESSESDPAVNDKDESDEPNEKGPGGTDTNDLETEAQPKKGESAKGGVGESQRKPKDPKFANGLLEGIKGTRS